MDIVIREVLGHLATPDGGGLVDAELGGTVREALRLTLGPVRKVFHTRD